MAKSSEAGVSPAIAPSLVMETTGVRNEVEQLSDKFQDVCLEPTETGPPPLQHIQLAIDFVHGAHVPNLTRYRMALGEHQELHRQITKLMDKDYLRPSKSTCAVSTLITPKKDGRWRMCVDNSVINKIIAKYRFPIPCLDNLLDSFHGAKVFTKLES